MRGIGRTGVRFLTVNKHFTPLQYVRFKYQVAVPCHVTKQFYWSETCRTQLEAYCDAIDYLRSLNSFKGNHLEIYQQFKHEEFFQ